MSIFLDDVANYLSNNMVTETNFHTQWEALKCFVPGHTIHSQCRTKKKNAFDETMRT